MFLREQTRPVHLRNITIGGSSHVIIQSMTTTPTADIGATLGQIDRLVRAGCEVVRVSVPDDASADALPHIVRRSPIPVVADIHFSPRLALRAIEAGVDKLRINPGNIGKSEQVKEVVLAAKEAGIPIRIGVNAGSIEKDLLARYGHPTAEAMVESALREVRMLESFGFYDIVISLKASNVPTAIEAYRRMAEEVAYPLHVGITESGTLRGGTIKSAVGVGAILAMGIGNTIRISLSADPVEEVYVARQILTSLGLRTVDPEVIACPTCARCHIDVFGIAQEVEQRVQQLGVPLKIAVMGCAVNGPGEAREADIGIAGGRGEGLLFRHGEPYRKVPEEALLPTLMAEVEAMAAEMQGASTK